MKKKIILLLALIHNLSIFSADKDAKKPEPEKPKKESPLKPFVEADVITQMADNIKVNLVYKEKNLLDIVNELVKLKQVNLYIPQDVNLNQKVTLDYGLVNLNQAWNYMQLMLETLGYSIVRQNRNYTIINLKKISQEPLPLYINTDPNSLPSSEDPIRYLYYFININIGDKNNAQAKTNIENILKDMLPSYGGGGAAQPAYGAPYGAAGAGASESSAYIFDPNSNSVLLTSKASSIRNVMRIVNELDKTGFREAIEVIPLYHANAELVSKTLNQLIPGQGQDQTTTYSFGVTPQTPSKFGYYFSESTKVTFIDKTNSVAILGTKESVARVKDFILQYLDKPLESGKSVIHVKHLQFLDASDLATILQSLVAAQTGNAQSVTQQQLKDTLANVKIIAEKPQPAPQIQTQNGDTVSTQAPIIGSNNIIIAAMHEDWLILEQLIDELDIPQLQVALETLIVELTITDTKLIGAQIRNPTIGLPENFNWQSAQIIKPWLNFIPPGQTSTVINTTRGLAADLLQMTDPANLNLQTTINPVNMALLADAGTTVLSINDDFGITGILEILENFGNATILSQPFVVTKNYKPATISIAQTRLVSGSVQQQSTGGPAVIPVDNIAASLTVQMTPRISRSNNINLEITVTANSFVTIDLNDNTINKRLIITNANVGNKEVLVLGGLTKDSKTDSTNDSPLSRIPLVGYFFKNKKRVSEKDMLMIFIQPTIIHPRLGGGVDPYTQGKLEYTKRKQLDADFAVDGALFENLRDPITRVFFPPVGHQYNEEIENYEQTGVFGKDRGATCFNKPKCVDLECQCTTNCNEDKCSQEHLEKAEKIKALAQAMANPIKK